MLIDWAGRCWPTDPRFLAIRFSGCRDPAQSLAFAVEELGCMHLKLARDLLFIAFCPGSATRLALIATFYAMSDFHARRFVLVHQGIPEICSNAAAAMRRMEALIDRLRPDLPAKFVEPLIMTQSAAPIGAGERAPSIIG